MRLEKGVECIRVGRHYTGKGQVGHAALGEGEGNEEAGLDHMVEGQPRHQPLHGPLKELHRPQHRPGRQQIGTQGTREGGEGGGGGGRSVDVHFILVLFFEAPLGQRLVRPPSQGRGSVHRGQGRQQGHGWMPVFIGGVVVGCG